MDHTRKFDLEIIEKDKREARNTSERLQAEKLQYEIRAKSHDPVLADMRRQLANASRDPKGRGVKLLSERIKAYERSKR